MLSDEEISEIEKCALGAPYSNIPAHPISALIATIRELKDAAARSANTIDGLIVQREKYREALECYVNCPYWLDEGKKAREALKDE